MYSKNAIANDATLARTTLLKLLVLFGKGTLGYEYSLAPLDEDTAL
jgi:hypothetical protein